MGAKFTKNDNGFICANCGCEVKPLGYTSRDHCPKCLVSLHVDINPGDRENTCKGMLIPIGIQQSTKKGIVINYRCNKCGEFHNNKAAIDDDFDTILRVSNGSYNN